MPTKKAKTSITHRVPAWSYCNLQQDFAPHMPEKGQFCRFCVKNKAKGFTCVLTNDVLSTEEGLVKKTCACERASAGFEQYIEGTDALPNGKLAKGIMKYALDEFLRIYKKLLQSGLPEAIAERAARDTLLGG